MTDTRSAREWAIVGGVYLALVLIAAVWLAVDRTPPEWDHANHLERVVHCAEDLARGDVRTIIERSSFSSAGRTMHGGPRVPAGAVGRGGGPERDPGVSRPRHGRGLSARPARGRRYRGRRGRGRVRLRAVRGVLGAALPARSAAGGDGRGRAARDPPHRGLHQGRVVAGRGDRVRRGHAHQAAVRGVRPRPGSARRRLELPAPSRGRLRGAGDPGGGRAQRAVVRAAPLRPAPQIANRSFKQAAESGHPDPLTATALLLYPTWLAPQLGVLALLLLLVGIVIAAMRRQWIVLAALLAPFLLSSCSRTRTCATPCR